MITLDNSDLMSVRYLEYLLCSLPQNSRGIAPARNLLDKIAGEITASVDAGPATEEAVALYSEHEESAVIVLAYAPDKRRAAQVAALRLVRDVLSMSTHDIGDALPEIDTAIRRIGRGESLLPVTPRAVTVIDQDIDRDIDSVIRDYLYDDARSGSVSGR